MKIVIKLIVIFFIFFNHTFAQPFVEQTGISLTGIYDGSVAWGDYDNDGDLDILLTGLGISKIYKNNGNNTFSETGISLTGVYESSAAWGDYDNDGDLDILLTGSTTGGGSGAISRIYINNGNDTFSETNILFTGLSGGSCAWGDYDNDGDLDILLSGYNGFGKYSKIYRNEGSDTFIEQTSILLTGVYSSSVAWGDYDNDGDLDIILTGSNGSTEISKIYKNEGNNTFTETNISLTGIYDGSVAWGDYDNDGDLDILLTGMNGSGSVSKIYKNNGNNTFIEQSSISLTEVYQSYVAWGDYDNDGDLDILLTGSDGAVWSKIYKNNGDNTFTEQTDISLTSISNGSVAWGDYDNDGDLDILLTGSDGSTGISIIYRNDVTTSNTAPNIPQNLTYSIVKDNVTISWDKATDTETPDDALQYNLFVASATDTIVMPHANTSNGFYKAPLHGNVVSGISQSIKLSSFPVGDYYAKVQSIDHGYGTSDFSVQVDFTVSSATYAQISPSYIEFNDMTAGVNTSQSQNLQITNTGNEDLIITALSFDNSLFTTTQSLPLTITAANTATLVLKYLPTSAGKHTGNLTIVSNHDNNTDITVPLTGYATEEPICGVIEANTTWTKANSPYYISCNSSIDAGITLDVGAGVEIFIEKDIIFNVDGNINFNGIEGDTIYIQSHGGGNFSKFNVRGSGKVTANYIRMKEARRGFYLKDATETFNIKNSVFENCDTAFMQENESTANTTMFKVLFQNNNIAYYNDINSNTFSRTIDSCSYKNNITAIILYSGGYSLNSFIKNSVFDNNGTAIYMKIYQGLIKLIEGNTISNNTTGIYWDTNNETEGDGTIKNNTFIGNQTAIDLQNGKGIISYNILTNNTIGIKTNTTGFTANYNTIKDNTNYNIEATLQASGTFDARYNNFGTNVDDDIKASIYDYYDNTDLIKINYSGYGIIAPPTNFSANIIDISSVELSWTDNADDETSYELYRSVNDNTSFSILSSLTANTESYTDATITTGNTYYYKLNAQNTNGSSPEIDTLTVVDNLFVEQTDISLTDVYLSSVAWGDYDNDGDLDILLAGQDAGKISKIYKNNGDNTFTDINISIDAVFDCSVAWGDYDNDGDLDILLTGNNGGLISKIYKNIGSDSFTEQTDISLTGVNYSSVAWGDYDNDGDLDILLTGNSGSSNIVSKIYKNTGSDFEEQTSISIYGVYQSSVAWGDYDNDGDLDILLTGYASSKIYKNNGNNTFTETNISLTGIAGGYIAWGDYDNDGDLDILLTGSGISKIYKNEGDDTFTEQNGISLTGVNYSSVAWGDYDNDGDLDILLTGFDETNNISKIYKNTDSNFEEQTDISLTGIYKGSVAWADYDNDGDLDILLTGTTNTDGSGVISKIYKNNISIKNTVPSAPANLSTSINNGIINFIWDSAMDTETATAGLNYNIRIGTATGLGDIRSSQALSSGKNLLAERGMIQDTSFVLKDLEPGIYYWSIQAVDNSFAGGPFSEESSFVMKPLAPEATDVTVCENLSTTTLVANGTDIKWYANDDYTNLLTEGGTYSTTVTEAGVYHYYVSQTISGFESFLKDVTFTINSLPTASFNCGDTTICEGETIPILLTGSPPWDLNISSGTTTSHFYPENSPALLKVSLNNGTYKFLSIKDNIGCEATDLGSSIEVSVNPLPQENFISSTSSTRCINTKNEIFTVQNPEENHSFFWEITNGIINAGQNTDKISVEWDIEGSASITLNIVNSETTCKGTAKQIFSINPDYAPNISELIQKSEVMLLSVDSGYSYNWYFNGEEIDGAHKQYFYDENMKEGDYKVEIIDYNSCYTYSNIITFVGTDNKNSLSKTVNIYPNPTNGNVKIEVDNDLLCKINFIITDNTGRIKLKGIINKTQKFVTFEEDLSKLKIGNYHLELYFDGKEKVSKHLIIK